MYKKSQITVPLTGKVTGLRPLGWTPPEKLESDMERERERFSKLAQHGIEIQSVEVTDATVVAIYKNGVVRVVRWEQEP